MRLVKKHTEVGYRTPEQRDRCGNCKAQRSNCEDRPGFPERFKCKTHGIECGPGGWCPDHERQGMRQAGTRTADLFAPMQGAAS
jgi:hypothetical protein